jgi:general secretion pathway protein K
MDRAIFWGQEPRRQSGAAIIMAMLIMALSTLIISGLFWRQQVTIRSIENRLALSQTRWIERAAVDWARVIIRSDGASSNVDHLGEVWALPVADTSLDETVTAGAQIDSKTATASLSGQIVDAQSKFNLNNLLRANGQPNDREADSLKRLFALLNVSTNLIEPLLAYQMQARSRTFDGQTIAPANLPLKRVSDLARIEGFTPAIIDVLEPYVFVLPGPSTVNINTASAEILSALLPLELAAAKSLVTLRERQVFINLDALSKQLPQGLQVPAERWSVESGFFIVRGNVKYDRVIARSDTLLERKRSGTNRVPNVEVIWQDRF